MDIRRELTEVSEEFITRDTVFGVFGESLVDESRLVYPKDASGLVELDNKLHGLTNQNDAVVVLVDGAFDVPQPNHDWYLRHCRLLGAGLYLDKWQEPLTRHNLLQIVSSACVRLVVTVDADAKLDAIKSTNPEKGGVTRPIYPWRLRAERVAGLTFTDEYDHTRHVVDLVTVEGDPAHQDTILESSLTLAKHMTEAGILDGLVVYGEHMKTYVRANELGINTLVIANKTNYAINPDTGEPWSSSDFINRAQKR